MELIRLAFSNLWRRRGRTLLTMLGIAVAISFVIGILSLSEGFIVSLKGMAEKRGEDLLVVSAEQPFPLMGGMGVSKIPEELLPQLAAQENVQKVYPILMQPIFGEEARSFVPLHLYGVIPEYFTDLRPYLKIAQGRLFQSGEQALVLTREGTRRLNARLGEKVLIKGTELEVVGILEEGEPLIPTLLGYTPIDTLQRLYDISGVSFITLKLRDPAKAKETAKRLNHEFKGTVRAVTLGEAVSQALDVLRLAQAMDFSFTFVALVISTLFILTTMVMAISERTREIGTLRALGMPRGLIFRIIIYESVLLGLLGGLGGILGGVGFSRGIELMVERVFELGEAFIEPTITLKLYILGLAISLLMGVIGGLYPALKLSRANIVQALRYE